MRWLAIAGCLAVAVAQVPQPSAVVEFGGSYSRSFNVKAGATVEVSVGLPAPSKLPANGRVAVEFGGYRKVLHALDPDFYMVYRPAKTGPMELKVSAVTDEEADFNLARWREPGTVLKADRFPKSTPWPAGLRVPLRAQVTPVDFGVSKRGMIVEVEPNNSIAEAQPIQMGAALTGESGTDETLHITGSADDIEYFDNGKVGTSGLDWFRIEYKGSEPRIFTANLVVPDPLVVAQVLFYTADGKEYREGANANERVHQQTEGHRTEITRTLQPKGVYFLKVEANSPGYEVELRLRKPGPYTDPRQAVRMAMYDQVSQVDAWLQNRPRGAAVERRSREVGSLLGTHCMSCHTQSGVWGSAGAVLNGYRIENVANYRHLLNLMYESLRPTNVLQDAANNTSLAPLDLGDGPAGTRVAGYNVAMAEKFLPARRLHSAQQIRTANFVLQSSDPSGINAAGPGSNVGQSVVYRLAGEILRTAWDRTHDEKYLASLEEKAQKLLKVRPQYSDDLSNRIEFFTHTFPQDYVAVRGESDAAKKLWDDSRVQIAADEKKLRSIQKDDGAWGFNPNGALKDKTADAADTDPAPTALAVTALAGLGHDDKDPAVRRGVDALLKMQDPYGRWNRAALTGFVTTAYTIHALSRLYPETPVPHKASDYAPVAGESLADTIARFREMAQLGLQPEDWSFIDLILPGADNANPQVRYWAQIALGAVHNELGIAAQVRGLGDPVKMVREAARWGMRQTLLDDKGWDVLFAAYPKADDLTREAMAGAMVMRADGVLSRTAAGFPRVAGTLARMMNDDPSPAVRAWSTRAAWNWWVWNPPVRKTLNEAFLTTLEKPESSALVETTKRYQTEALFIANGQRANGSKEHQYPELAQLFAAITKKLETGGSPLLARRVAGIAGTYYSMAGGDGGPGQMGYVTPGSAEMVGKALLPFWAKAESEKNDIGMRLAIEASANATYDPLQKKVLSYSSEGPESMRTLAATSLSDPRVISLPATMEFLEPLAAQIFRGAQDAERRTELAGSLIKLFSRARWDMPKSEEQQRTFFGLLVPVFAPERGKLEENTHQLAQMEKDPTDWYVAKSIGQVIHTNPDLHRMSLLERFPLTFNTQMDEMLWLPSIKWLLTHELPMPEVHKPVAVTGADSYAPFRDRAVSLYLRQFETGADRRLRSAAVALGADVHVNRHPAIRPVLAKAQPRYVEPDVPEVAAMSKEWRENFEYFRTWVAPELTKTNREDEFACLGCHGVPGRVPSMGLQAADDNGYLSAKATYLNYTTLLERVDERDVEKSKLLRKPLNVQSGKEDGHQGGRRFNPGDRGYEILRRWVLDSAGLKGK